MQTGAPADGCEVAVVQRLLRSERELHGILADRRGEEMKLEIEITEAEIKSAIELKVRTAVADQTNQWNVDNYIKDQVKKHWQAAVESLVLEMLNDSPRMREKIQASIEAKLRGQITALMKEKK